MNRKKTNKTKQNNSKRREKQINKTKNKIKRTNADIEKFKTQPDVQGRTEKKEKNTDSNKERTRLIKP